MSNRVQTIIPGRSPIELAAFYEEFRDYYPHCELETKRWFVENVQPDWWIFDIGANIGYYTILFAQLAARGRVLAFEPTKTADMLRQNLEHNRIRNAEVHELALGASTGTRADRIYRMWGTAGETKAYPFSRLDDFVAERKPARIDCLKIDVDSFDFEVLCGAERTLLEYEPVIVIELNEALAKRYQSPNDALAWLAERGYDQALILDRDNFMLRRRGARVDDSGACHMELVFPPPQRLTESLAPGDNAAERVVLSARLETGAAAGWPGGAFPSDKTVGAVPTLFDRLLRRTPASPDRRFAFPSILGVPVETSTAIWSYALILEMQVPPLARGEISVEIAVEVSEGKLGVAFAGRDAMVSAARERRLSAMPGTQRVVIATARTDGHMLIFRTAAFEGIGTVFTIRSIDVRLHDTSNPSDAQTGNSEMLSVRS